MLEIKKLSAAYGEKLIIHQVDLSVQAGEVLALIGPNGAGKSTLVRSVSGVLPIHSGSVLVNGKDLTRLNPAQRARYLAVVPQARSLPPAFTVSQAVSMGRTPYLGWLGQPGQQDQQQVRRALAATQTLEMSERFIGELSGGEQQRVLLARALAQDTPVLLLDEPTTHLDLQYQSNLLHLIRNLALRQNLAVLMVVHDLNLAGMFADRVAMLVEGRIFAQGTPGEVLTRGNLEAIYHIPVHVMQHPDYGTPLVLPDGLEPQKN